MDDQKEALRKKIDKTLSQFKDSGSTSDGFDIIRWARQGLLQRKDGE